VNDLLWSFVSQTPAGVRRSHDEGATSVRLHALDSAEIRWAFARMATIRGVEWIPEV